jgi:predicted small lipoprotein YifL
MWMVCIKFSSNLRRCFVFNWSNLYCPSDMRPAFRLAIVATLLAAVFGLAACGQRGPLYLPNPDSTNSSGKK